ncbi:DUF3221 domain-containing protein [Christensenellaceae bacterium NSJ-63]|uniref:DUF3221 domain-containing protein n=1 Tax=Guopingia tenuis TaxID=2763656 RepID=A0A926DIL8_9FIRM|nr:DUF3221 domain-containing protein [Guopingia tenuis]MBC8537750.1 DUF3221 domain-containing protein [Guopingia tenuis]
MTKRKRTILFAIALLLFSALIAGVFYFIGYKTAYDRLENATPTASQTFYAMISDIQGSTLHVAGLEVNDINFRGDFFFSVAEETSITWRYTDISLEDLDVGDRVSITFTGDILTTYPANITQVESIQLLDDEL